ncbi:MAG: hypothetical protein ACYDA6_11600, partial [Solirubrobacteraceae bacterium]
MTQPAGRNVHDEHGPAGAPASAMAGGPAHRWGYRQYAEEGGRDLTAKLEETGLSQKAAWYSAAARFGGGGILVLALCFGAAHLLPGGMVYLASVSVAIGALCGWWAPRLPQSPLALELVTHAR